MYTKRKNEIYRVSLTYFRLFAGGHVCIYSKLGRGYVCLLDGYTPPPQVRVGMYKNETLRILHFY